ncbi:uncharacterized protein EDB91DRAFT_1109196 [Suillus paluster]|uniref:uncharacterized protein n=1 Tax=Suillus paluster TaxID=48578 RepID=UPI001B863596|nr:uncharacterized protein EDB91DRAFT_1109196 [Suillus paluster]KAG1749704.1 hypothetical protein EDB91DRAFT_1109196 [Suillus paluster]
MSAQSIARWNAIPMYRPDTDKQEQVQSVQNQTISMKRSHQGIDDGDDDDDVSLVSRSPSPAPDAMDIEKYDEYVRGPEREVITVETKIKSTNKGFAMLAKFGWLEGQPLGLSADARVDPIPFHVKNDLTGLGKTTQDFRMIETTVAERRKLDSERQRKETEDQRKAREDNAARRAALKSEITDTLKAFYCSLCEKQFQNVAQYDEHTNSYAHHHKARLRDMQANTRITSQEDVDKRKEKERKREEKELRKIAKAAGIKMAKPPIAPTTVAPPAPAAEASLPSEAQSNSFKKAGWATVSTAVEPATGFKRSGWASMDSGASSAPSAPLPPPPPPLVSSPPPAARSAAGASPIFRTGGWTSLDVGSSQSVTSPLMNTAPPPPPNVAPPPPPGPPMNAPPPGGPPPFPPANARPPSVPLPPPSAPPPFPPTTGGWGTLSDSRRWDQNFTSAPKFSQPPPVPPPSAPPPTTGGWGSAALVSDTRRWDQSFAPAPTFSQPSPPAAAAPPTASLKAAVPQLAAPQAKTGWQQWKQGTGSKRR